MKKVRWTLLLIALGFIIAGAVAAIRAHQTQSQALKEIAWSLGEVGGWFVLIWLIAGVFGAVISGSASDTAGSGRFKLYEVVGIDRANGQPAKITVNARDPDEARFVAFERGLDVQGVRLFG